MSDPTTDRLVQARAAKESMIDTIKTMALDRAGNDGVPQLSTDEERAINAALEDIAGYDRQLDIVGRDYAMTDEVRNRLARVTRSVAPVPAYNRAGEVLWDILHQTDPDAQVRLRTAMNRAAEHMGTDKTKTVAVAGGIGGVVPTPVVGAVIDPYPAGMPFATALGLTDAPNALHWIRPRISDPGFTTGVGQQGTGGTLGFEKAELPSKAFDVLGDIVALKTLGTYINISQQLLSFMASALDTIVGHLNRRVANAVDAGLVAEMALSTGKVALAAGADAATILKAIYTASAAVYTATGELATWIVMGPLGFARLGGLVDLAGRPLFPTLGPVNAPGTANASTFMGSVAGLQAVVTPAITDDTFWVGNSAVMEGALYRYPVLEAVEPSVLGRQLAIAVSYAGYRPIANGAIHLFP